MGGITISSRVRGWRLRRWGVASWRLRGWRGKGFRVRGCRLRGRRLRGRRLRGRRLRGCKVRGWRERELYKFLSSTNSESPIKSEMVGWARLIVCTGETNNAFKDLVEKSTVKRRPGRSRNKSQKSTQYNILTLRVLMSYIYGAPILDVSRSHTTTQHSR